MTNSATILCVTIALTTAVDAAPSTRCTTVPIYDAGAHVADACEAAATAGGLTVVDLSDSWTPSAMAPGRDGVAPLYRDTYLALAAERFADAGADATIAGEDRYLEVYGVVPTLAVIAARLADDQRHRCHDAIDDHALADMSGVASEESAAAARARKQATLDLRRTLEVQARRRELPDLAALAAHDARYRRQVARLRQREAYLAGVRAAQAHLVCEGLLVARHADGTFTWRTAKALEAFQRRHVLAPDGKLGAESRSFLAEDPRELDYRAALRALRERIVAATGLIEDGSAGTGHVLVLGRELEPARNDRVLGHAPLEGAAPDLIGAATETAARALGWIDVRSTLAFLNAGAPARVAVELAPVPAYHSAQMELSIELDRGDVWYDTRPRSRPIDRRPALIVYAQHGTRRIPLVRWPTTIGGWNDEKLGSGEVVTKWKESPVGAFVWRDLFVAPTWLPPDTTPDSELVRRVDGHAIASESIGPSYRSAYGLVMLVHHTAQQRKQRVVFSDDGIRSHGSSKIASVFDGRSHGCHRLLPLRALRLAGFLIAHRTHVRRGETRTSYRRDVHYRGDHHIEVTTRGYRFELDPPVPVVVTAGNIRSERTTPATRVVR